jgi:hypothetical protein
LLSVILSDLTMIEENDDSIEIKDSAGKSSLVHPSHSLCTVGHCSRAGWLALLIIRFSLPFSVSPSIVIESNNESGALEEKLIHFEKMTMIYETLSVLKRCFAVSYSEAMMESVAAGEGKGEGTTEELLWMLKVLPRLPEKELYDIKGTESKKKVISFSFLLSLFLYQLHPYPFVLIASLSLPRTDQRLQEGVQASNQGKQEGVRTPLRPAPSHFVSSHT